MLKKGEQSSRRACVPRTSYSYEHPARTNNIHILLKAKAIQYSATRQVNGQVTPTSPNAFVISSKCGLCPGLSPRSRKLRPHWPCSLVSTLQGTQLFQCHEICQQSRAALGRTCIWLTVYGSVSLAVSLSSLYSAPRTRITDFADLLCHDCHQRGDA